MSVASPNHLHISFVPSPDPPHNFRGGSERGPIHVMAKYVFTLDKPGGLFMYY